MYNVEEILSVYFLSLFPSEISVTSFSDDNAENVLFESNLYDLQTRLLNGTKLFLWPYDTSSLQSDWNRRNDRDVGKESARAYILRYHLSCMTEGKKSGKGGAVGRS